MLYTIILLVVVLSSVLWLFRFYWSVLMTRDLPPGPFPLPVIGNLHLLSSNLHISLEELAKKYGGLMTVYLGTERTVIVSCPELAREVLVRQSTVFGGRPSDLPLGAILVGNNGRDIVFRHDMSVPWKMQRKLFHAAVKSFGSGLLVLENQVCDVVGDLIGQLRDHEGTVTDIEQNVRLCITNITCHMTFGSKYKLEDEEFKLMVKSLGIFSRSMAPGHLVDVFPFLRKLPIKFVRDIKEAIELRDLIIEKKFREHKSRLQDGDARDLVDALLKQHRADEGIQNKLTEEEIQMVASDIFIAGSETSAVTVLWGIYYLARHPDTQRAIHDEMRQCLESDTLPTFHDRYRLPFLQATIAEIYRYISIVPMLLPHRAVKDAPLGVNYVIPEDTMVMVNAWAIHHDSTIWREPHTFMPTRFLDENGAYSPPDPTTFLPFGAGKRGCVGEILGKMMVFVTLARMLYAFRFTLVSDENKGVETKRQVVLAPRSFEVFIEKNVR